MKAVDYYTYLYPQLTIVPFVGASQSDQYRDIALRGEFPDDLTFPMETNDEEELISVDTPIGKVEAIYLPIREVFERFCICLSNKCEPLEIPKTTGAMYISGINCWRKILKHQEEYIKTHDDWDDEFDRFTSVKENYKGIVLLISKGNYSACLPEFVDIEENKWLAYSKDIRIYHEITHAISRKLYPDHKEAVRDEVLADSIGTLYAFGEYKPLLIKKFLGTEGDTYRFGGRLENYVDKEKLDESFKYVNSLIEKIDDYVKNHPNKKPFEYLIDFEEEYIK